MAENNTVPLGQAGTGAAVILGEDNASQQFNRNLGQYNKMRQQLQAAEQQKAQQIAKSYRDNMLAAGDGKLFAKQLGDIEQKHLKQGMDYRAQGWDIYRPNPNDPKQMQAHEQYMSDRRTIENLRNYAKGIEGKFKTINDAIAKGRAGEYKQSDIDAMHNFINGTDLLEAYNSGADLPSVNKNFDLSKALTGVQAPTSQNKYIKNGMVIDETVIDLPKAESKVISAIMNSNGGEEYLMEITGGVPINEVKSLPKTKEAIRKRREADYDGIPQLREALAIQQIKKGNAAYEQWLDEDSDRLYNARKGFDEVIKNGVDRTSGGVKRSVTPDYQGKNYNLAVQREARIARGDTNSQASTPQDLAIPFADGNGVALGRGYVKAPMTTKNFAGSSAIDLYTGKPTKLNTSSNDYEVVGVANFPFITKGNQKGNLSQPNFAQNNPNAIEDKPMIHVQLKEGGLVSDYLIPYDRMPSNLSKANKEALASFKPNNSKNSTQQAPKTISKSQIRSRASASGYTDAEYTKLLIEKGIKIVD